MENEDDLPKSIVVILVILAVFISVLGTFTVISEMNKINVAPVEAGTPTQSAKVSLRVENPNQGISQATGKVTFKVQGGQ